MRNRPPAEMAGGFVIVNKGGRNGAAVRHSAANRNSMTLESFIFALEIMGTIAFAMSGVMTAKARHMDIFGALILGCTAAVGGGVIRDLIMGKTPPTMFRNPVYVGTAAATSLAVFLFEYIRQRLSLRKAASAEQPGSGTAAAAAQVRAEDPAAAADPLRSGNTAVSAEQPQAGIAAARPAREEPDAYVKDLYHGESAADPSQEQDSSDVYHSARTDLILNIADTIGLAAFVAVGTRTGFERGFSNNLFLCIFVGTLTGVGGGIMRDMMAGEIPLILRRHVYGLAAVLGAIAYCAVIRSGGTSVDASLVSMAVVCLIRYLAIHYRLNLPAFR